MRNSYEPYQRTLSARDLRALAFIGEGYEVAQYHLQEAVFADLSPTVASRFVCRVIERRLVAGERLHNVGMNRLRLTDSGRELLVSFGHRAEHLFAPRRPVALKDLAHTLRINDLRVILGSRKQPPSELFPAWMLQRLHSADVVPDLLAVWRARASVPRSVLACEVDLNTENLARVFLPKLKCLAESLTGERGAVLILTNGRRRADLLREFAERHRTAIPIMVEMLPRAFGARGLEDLRKQLTA
jgi:hypothetical protein